MITKYHDKVPNSSPRDTFWVILMPAVKRAMGLEKHTDCAGIIQEAYLQWAEDLALMFGEPNDQSK